MLSSCTEGLAKEMEGALGREIWAENKKKIIVHFLAFLYYFKIYQSRRYKALLSKMFTEKVWLSNFCLPPFCIVLSHLLREKNEDDKDKETLEGNKDGEDVSESKELLNFYH